MDPICPPDRALIKPESADSIEELPDSHLSLHITPWMVQYGEHVGGQPSRLLQYFITPAQHHARRHRPQQAEPSERCHLELLTGSAHSGLSASLIVQEASSEDELTANPTKRLDKGSGQVRASLQQEKHNEKRNEVLESLEPMIPLEGTDMCTILVCYGESTSCTVLPVSVPTGADTAETLTRIHQSVDQHRRPWWKNILGFAFDVTGVKEVEVSITKRHEVHRGQESRTEYLGIYLDDKLEKEKVRLEQIIKEYQPFESIEEKCEYNEITGGVDHCNSCDDVNSADLPWGEPCPLERCLKAKRRLQRLTLQPTLLLQAFQDPGSVKSHDLLSDHLVMSHRDILEKLSEWHCPSLHEPKFPALLIRGGWTLSSWNLGALLSGAVVLCSVIVYLPYRDWSTAWAALSALVPCFLFALTRPRDTTR